MDSVIAAELGISIHTVRSHMERLFRKLHVGSRTGVVVAFFPELRRRLLSGVINPTIRAPPAAAGERRRARRRENVLKDLGRWSRHALRGVQMHET